MTNNPIAIIAFAGPAGSGKDTCGNYLIENYGFRRLSFAKPLKMALEAMDFPEPATQEEKERIIPELGVSWRHMAQTLGTEWGRNMVHSDLWVILAERRVRQEGGAFVITDCRFENEATLTRKTNGVVAHIQGRSYAMPKATAGHLSEAGIAMAPNDYIIDNAPLQRIGKLKEDTKESLPKLYAQLDHLASLVGVKREPK